MALPNKYEHTGDAGLDRLNRHTNEVAKQVNALEVELDSFEETSTTTTTGLDTRLTAAEAAATALTTRVTTVEKLGVGRANISMANANQVISAANAAFGTIRTSDAATANRTLSGFSLPGSEAEFYTRLIQNSCSGAFSVLISNGGAATATVGNGTNAIVGFSTGGCVKLL